MSSATPAAFVSAMSTITTSASSFCATTRATVAPTLPAPPTTVTFRFIGYTPRSGPTTEVRSGPRRTWSGRSHILWKTLWKRPVEDAATPHEVEQITVLHHVWCACRRDPVTIGVAPAFAWRRPVGDPRRGSWHGHKCRIIPSRGSASRSPAPRARRVPLRMHIVIADELPRSAAQLLRDEGWSVDAASGRSSAELLAAMTDADALIVRSATTVTAALLDAAPTLRAIARAGVWRGQRRSRRRAPVAASS